jgi:circadian clock protein KaiC
MRGDITDSNALTQPGGETSPSEALRALSDFSAERPPPVGGTPSPPETHKIPQSDVGESGPALSKVLTGIAGLDDITHGGFPASRPTLVCGGAGCGKTILAMEFLVRGAREFDEPGLFVSFEETARHIVEDFGSLGFDLGDLIERKKLKIVQVSLAKDEIVEAGVFTLDGLLILLDSGIAQVGAKRVVLDTLEAVFSALSQTENLRTEIGRLFQWLKDKGVTAVVTGERGKKELTRHGFEGYISDCVILLDHRVYEQTSKRRLRIVKYRGSAHATDEFPFLISPTGLSVLPISSLVLDHQTSSGRMSSGVKDLDAMLEGQGYFIGTTVLISGKSGTGKSSLAAAFALAATRRGERCLYFSFEESEAQIERNMKSTGIDLSRGLVKKALIIRAFRPTYRGLEEHLVSVMRDTELIKPTCVVMDPITNFVNVGGVEEVRSMLTRILDSLKRKGITLLMTALTQGGKGKGSKTEVHLSSLVDTWIALDLELKGDVRHRTLYIVKSRGMNHSQTTRDLLLSSNGLSIADPLLEVEP